MRYISKGAVTRECREEILYVSRCGSEYALSKPMSTLWLEGRFGISQTRSALEEVRLAHLVNNICVVAQNTRFDKLRELYRYEKHIMRFNDEYDGRVGFEEIYASILPSGYDFAFGDTLHADSYEMLGEKSQLVLRYTFIHGYSKDKVAGLLGCRRGSVTRLLHRAISRMRELIERGEIEV